MSSKQFKKKYVYQNKPHYGKFKKYVMEPGLKGFLCTCNYSEKTCIQEAYHILNLYLKKLHPPSEPDVPSEPSKSEEICDELSKEIEELKNENKKDGNLKPFQAIETGAKNCIFVKTTIDDPVELGTLIAQDINTIKTQQTRYLLRLVPIEATCKANLAGITTQLAPLLDKHFSGQEKTFAIVYKHRCNDAVNRDELIEKVAAMITEKNSNHKVNLSNPDVVILFEIVRGWCLISTLPKYYSLKKYNLIELSGPCQTETVPTEETVSSEEPKKNDETE